MISSSFESLTMNFVFRALYVNLKYFDIFHLLPTLNITMTDLHTSVERVIIGELLVIYRC